MDAASTSGPSSPPPGGVASAKRAADRSWSSSRPSSTAPRIALIVTATITRMADTMPMTVTISRVCSVQAGRRRFASVSLTPAP